MTGPEFKYLIRLNDLTQSQVAELLGVSRQTINTWCKSSKISDSDEALINNKIKLEVKTNRQSELTKVKIEKGVPVYDVDATAGSGLDFSDHLPEHVKGYISLPNFKNCIAFIMVRGDSMYPKFKAGDLIGIEPVGDIDIIQWGHAYVVLTHDNQRMLKYVRKGKDDKTIILKSESDLYDDILLPKNKVLKMFMAKGPVRDDWQ